MVTIKFTRMLRVLENTAGKAEFMRLGLAMSAVHYEGYIDEEPFGWKMGTFEDMVRAMEPFRAAFCSRCIDDRLGDVAQRVRAHMDKYSSRFVRRWSRLTRRAAERRRALFFTVVMRRIGRGFLKGPPLQPHT